MDKFIVWIEEEAYSSNLETKRKWLEHVDDSELKIFQYAWEFDLVLEFIEPLDPSCYVVIVDILLPDRTLDANGSILGRITLKRKGHVLISKLRKAGVDEDRILVLTNEDWIEFTDTTSDFKTQNFNRKIETSGEALFSTVQELLS